MVSGVRRPPYQFPNPEVFGFGLTLNNWEKLLRYCVKKWYKYIPSVTLTADNAGTHTISGSDSNANLLSGGTENSFAVFGDLFINKFYIILVLYWPLGILPKNYCNQWDFDVSDESRTVMDCLWDSYDWKIFKFINNL